MATITIAGVPNGKCCLWQVDKILKGQRTADSGSNYECDAVKTRQVKLSITLSINSTNLTCDQEVAQRLLPNSSLLESTGSLIQREGGFGHFTGEFTIKNKDGKQAFRGTMELFDRVGTHHTIITGEKCNQKSHLEGWLVGTSSEHTNVTLRAMLALKGVHPTKDAPEKTLSGILNGALITCS
jgi:hypothetical protein